MKATTIKREMHNAIDLIEDADFLKAIHLILNQKTKEYDAGEEELKELEQLKKLHEIGKSKSYSMAEVRKYAHGKLKK